jgi:protein O-GlcNAc transferase
MDEVSLSISIKLKTTKVSSDTWMQKAIEFCEKQLLDMHDQTTGLFITHSVDDWMALVRSAQSGQLSFLEENTWKARFTHFLQDATTRQSWSYGEAGFLIRLIEWYKTRIQHLLYIETHGQVYQSEHENATHTRENTTIPSSNLLSTIKNSRLPLILPFHTVSLPIRSLGCPCNGPLQFTFPLMARTIRLIAHRNALHTSFTAFTQLGKNLSVHPIPRPPLHGRINIGYVSSDFS